MAENDKVVEEQEVTLPEESTTPLTHPDLLPTQSPEGFGRKLRRTIVRTAKLINPGGGDQAPSLVQVPIEPSHNNHGVTDDPSAPLRHYLNKGFVFPAEYDPKKYNFLYCAVSDCWEHAEWPVTERCVEHERMWQMGFIRYDTRRRTKPRV